MAPFKVPASLTCLVVLNELTNEWRRHTMTVCMCTHVRVRVLCTIQYIVEGYVRQL